MHTTFWVIGANVVYFPDVLHTTISAGHMIGTSSACVSHLDHAWPPSHEYCI
ncbi:hypothetical protein BC830DRAFT_1157925 [Chytriomyces sp. MP71]|nr:hypothetical protein BC830DRAFT_1157925 [Chytriomyces sp. MP71]